MPTEVSARELQREAKLSARQFLDAADDATDPRDAANWSLAAKNAVSVAVSCETILKVRSEAERRR
jgi:hypothetical protein